jgi:uncharacterized small protein (DUF1192 family)
MDKAQLEEVICKFTNSAAAVEACVAALRSAVERTSAQVVRRMRSRSQHEARLTLAATPMNEHADSGVAYRNASADPKED